MPTKDLRWAAKIIIQLANVPVRDSLINAFVNYDQNKMWVKSIMRAAAPTASTLSNPAYQDAIAILREHGISDNLYDTGS